MIQTIDLCKNFGKLQALDHVNLSLKKGECVALIGPNACGKTTLIKSMLGMVIPSAGEIMFREKKIAHDYEYRRHIGYMPQIGRYPQNMKIGQVVEMIRSIRNAESPIDEDLLFEFKLKELYHKRMGTLSGGTTQKVSAVLAFLFDPEVLILDEPTAGLDPVAAEILKEKIIAEKKKNKLILITSHLLSELDDLVSQVVFMQEGKLKFHQSLAELKGSTGEEKISRAIARILRNGVTV
jgi:Cu-processing system ATP-binding protein